MAVDRSKHVRLPVTLPHGLRSAITAYRECSGIGSESEAIRSLLTAALAADVQARVAASAKGGIARPGRPMP